jgi:integrase
MAYKIKQRAGNGVFFVEFEGLDGKRQRKSLGTRDETVAKVKAREVFFAAVSPHAQPKVSPMGRTNAFTLTDAFERLKRTDWSPDQIKAKATYWSDAECIGRKIGHLDVRDITFDVLEKFVADCRADGLGFGTIDKRLSRIGAALRKAAMWTNPATGKPYLKAPPPIPRVKLPPRRDKVVSLDQERALLAACDELAKCGRQANDWWSFRQLIVWLLDTGMRKGEALGFTLNDIRDEVVFVAGDDTKTGQAKAIPLTARLLKMVETFRAMGIPADCPVFGSSLGISKVQEMWSPVLAECGMEDYHIHDLRHTAATRWRQRGMSLDTIARLLGHSTPTITYQVYQHLDPADLVREMRQADASASHLRLVGH